MAIILCSSCLIWWNARYDWSNSKIDGIIEFFKGHILYAVCPEQLWWLPTPRPRIEVCNWLAVDKEWNNYSDKLLNWASQVLDIAINLWIKVALMNDWTTSCGYKQRPDWKFQWNKVYWIWYTPNVLERNWIKVFSQYDLNILKKYLELID